MNGNGTTATQTVGDAVQNHFQMLHFRTIRPILLSDVPTPRKQSRSSELRKLEVVLDFNTLLGHIKDGLVTPAEVSGELALDGKDVNIVRTKKKSFMPALRALLKSCIKDFGLDEQIKIVERDHSTRLFVVGRTA